MKHFFGLLRYEIYRLLIAPSSYAVGVLFLIFMGIIYLYGLEDAVRFERELSPAVAFFRNYWWPVAFMVPMLTMRSLAEERRLGTLEATLTTPVSALSIVVSKFLGAYLFYMFLWAITLVFPWVVSIVVPSAVTEGALTDTATLSGGLLFIGLSGLLYVAVGIFTSSLTRTQLIAGMLSFCILFILIVGGKLMTQLHIIDPTWAALFNGPLEYLQTFKQLDDFSKGILDSRPFIFYITGTFLILGLTTIIVETKA